MLWVIFSTNSLLLRSRLKPPGRPSALPRGRQGVVVKAKQAYIIVPEGFQADFEPKFNKALKREKEVLNPKSIGGKYSSSSFPKAEWQGMIVIMRDKTMNVTTIRRNG
ncbi:MAG: hypothetical protein AB1393_07355 [Candidatus Edwardsbacteria bacterium]